MDTIFSLIFILIVLIAFLCNMVIKAYFGRTKSFKKIEKNLKEVSDQIEEIELSNELSEKRRELIELRKERTERFGPVE
jgi:F0F1-type ATP synthase membrane subunit b/b'